MATSPKNDDKPGTTATAAPATPLGDYTVTQVPVQHDGVTYDIGQPIRLTDKQAERLGSLVAPAAAA